MSSGKLELADGVPKPELGNQKILERLCAVRSGQEFSDPVISDAARSYSMGAAQQTRNPRFAPTPPQE